MRNTKYILLIFLFLGAVNFTEARENVKHRTTKATKSAKSITAACLPGSSEINMDLNNVRTIIMTQGGMWTDANEDAAYEVPKGSLKTALYAGGIWVGGVDVNGQLRTCARTFRSAYAGNDYWPGPLTKGPNEVAYVEGEICSMFDRHWKIKRSEVEEFLAWYEADAETRATRYADYVVPEVIQEWPGNGPTQYGEYDNFLAPFYDADGDMVYNYNNGDYPYFVLDKNTPCKFSPVRAADNLGSTSQKLFGDETIWWVYNDKGDVHTSTVGAAAIGMEFRAQGFAFSTNDELNNMTFYNYQIINRSTFTLTDAYFGVWEDPDLGDPTDDLAGCDVVRGLGYVYNATNTDGTGLSFHYGLNPPAIGIDFFEGPYQDIPESGPIDKPSSWEEPERVNLNCYNGYGFNEDSVWVYRGPGNIKNGNVNGLNFGDGIAGNERWGMRRFVYYKNGGDGFNGDPETALEYYRYLTGYWTDGVRMTYGGNGHDGTKAADFMYPDNTDVCGWGVGGEMGLDPWNMLDEDPADQRIIQSAGPFTLEPGAVNDITIGVVWARSNEGYWQSVDEVRKADIKAQRLFENCFQLVDGPTAPTMDIVELDGRLIFHISNEEGSNNYLEGYREKDPFITADVENEDDLYYIFQGYQVYQVKNSEVTSGELYDYSKARIVFQCDIKDGVTNLVNYTWDDDLQATVPTEMVQGADKGIAHTFEVTKDMFGSEDTENLINYREYYYYAVAYAYNNYEPYDPVNEGTTGNQTKPYLAGRKNFGVNGTGKPYVATPQAVDMLDNGVELNSSYGDVPQISVLDGRMGGSNYLRLSEETKNNILSKTAYPYEADVLTFAKNSGPVSVKVIDPLNVIDADFQLKVLPDTAHMVSGYYNSDDTTIFDPKTGVIFDALWELSYEDKQGVPHVYTSDSWIRVANEKLIPEIGLSVLFEQIDVPTEKWDYFPEKDNAGDNGYIGGDFYFDDNSHMWLDFISDVDGQTAFNWIRVGRQLADDNTPAKFSDIPGIDNDQAYEGIIAGKWAPYFAASYHQNGLALEAAKTLQPSRGIYRTASVDIVITKDRDLWTRCPVVETAENNDDGTNSLSEGGVIKFSMRAAPSRDKDGNWDTTLVARQDTLNPESPNFINPTGMSWFPGYAIDVETGKRLNMVFGEDSWLVGENGNDMLWNPTSSLGDYVFNTTGGLLGTPYLGGKHFIYVFAANDTCAKVLNCIIMPSYDYGETLTHYLQTKASDNNNITKDNAAVWRHCAWTAIPYVNEGYEFKNYEDMPDNDVTIELRMGNPHAVNVNQFASEDVLNNNYPLLEFSTSDLSATRNDPDFVQTALDRINIVPNPYYGYSEYELTQLDNFVKIVNLPERCIVSIYTANGNLIRKFDKDNSDTYILWDLKNQYDVSIASGMYIFHIQAPEIGEERILKWFGSLRPTDLNSF